jgi:hypothetical protein
MKHIKIILGLILFASVSTFAQSPRIKLNQITKDTVTGSVLISSPSDSGMVYSRDFYISYGADTVLILYGDTISGGGGLSSVLSDGVTITGDGTSGTPLSVVDDGHNHVISNVDFLQDSLTAKANASELSNYVTIAGTETITGAKTFTSDLNIDAKIALNAGDDNIVIGDGAGASLVSGQALGNLLVGKGAGAAINSGDYNVATGYEALYSATTASNNTANGFQALYSTTTGSDNVANGYYALRSNLSGARNLANGWVALYNLNSGSDNQGYGFQAGRYLFDGTTALTTANGSLFLGNNTKASANGNTNEIVIGDNAIGNGSNTITIGSSSTQSLHTRNYEFDIDQTLSATEDNYVLTYDDGDGQISLEPIALSNSATLDFGSTSAQSSADLTITVTGAADGDVVSLGVPNASVNANTNYTAWVSAANTVTVRFNNYSSGAVDPASGTFKVKVFK